MPRAHDVEGGPVDRLEHGREGALGIDVAGRRDAEAAGQRRGEIGQDVGVQVGGDDGVDAGGIGDEARGHGVDEHAVGLDVGIVRP